MGGKGGGVEAQGSGKVVNRSPRTLSTYIPQNFIHNTIFLCLAQNYDIH